MRDRLLAALVLGGAMLAAGAAAQPAAQGQECTGAHGAAPDTEIKNCSAFIDSGKGDAAARAAAYKARGNAWSAKGDSDRAIADYTQAIRLDPAYAVAYSNRGLAYTDKGEFDRAIADFTAAIRINPLPPGNAHVNVYVNRGAAYAQKGDLDRAIADYNAAIRIDPTYALSYHDRGVAYADKGDLDRAIADADEAIRLDPTQPDAFSSRGIDYAAKGDAERAMADFNQAIRIDPNSAFGYDNRGRANLYAGSLPKALADLNEATKLDPTYAYAALWLEVATRRSNLPSRLADAAKQIDMTKWPAPIIRLYLGQSTLPAVLAAADSPNALSRKDRFCEANFWGGEFAVQQGHTEEARRLFGVAAADCPKGYIEYASAKAELAALGEHR